MKKIAFISIFDPNDIQTWSGTLAFIFKTLKKNHDIHWITEGILQEFLTYRNNAMPFINTTKSYFFEIYSFELCSIINKKLKKTDYDLVIVRDYILAAYLDTDIPIIHIGDATFEQYNQQVGLPNGFHLQLINGLENRMISNCASIIYSSNWAKQSAINYYQADSSKINVVEFGANLNIIRERHEIISHKLDSKICHLLTIGIDVKRKGIEKAYNIYLYLKHNGFPCKMTLIGCDPDFIDKTDPFIKVIPFLDKNNESDRLDEILLDTHFFLLPTLFDCFGIVFCEAAAYGIPSLANDSGGVHQVIRNNKNGFLFQPNASIASYAKKIKYFFYNPKKYQQLRESTRNEYDKRLNWDVWGKKVNLIIQNTLNYYSNSYITAYTYDLSKEGIQKEEYPTVEKCKSMKKKGILYKRLSLNNKETIYGLKQIIQDAQKNDEGLIAICSPDFSLSYTFEKKCFFRNIFKCYSLGCDLLYGSLNTTEQIMPIGDHLFWLKSSGSTKCVIIFKSLYKTILDYNIEEDISWETVISNISNNKMVIYPFICNH